MQVVRKNEISNNVKTNSRGFASWLDFRFFSQPTWRKSRFATEPNWLCSSIAYRLLIRNAPCSHSRTAGMAKNLYTSRFLLCHMVRCDIGRCGLLISQGILNHLFHPAMPASSLANRIAFRPVFLLYSNFIFRMPKPSGFSFAPSIDFPADFQLRFFKICHIGHLFSINKNKWTSS